MCFYFGKMYIEFYKIAILGKMCYNIYVWCMLYLYEMSVDLLY